MRTTIRHGAAMALAMAVALGAGAAAADETIFLSTQLRPIEEAQKVREVILADFPGEVDFIPEDTGPFLNRLEAEAAAGDVSVGVVGSLHGDLPGLVDKGVLDPIDDVMAGLSDRGFVEAFVDLGKLGTDSQLYVPWMQATYIMAANRKALEYLPEGVDINAITYEELAAWAAAVEAATGERRLGFPAGPRGLMHRFFQGYLYPSFTGGVVRTYKSAEAEAMWTAFRDLWAHVNPRSTAYDFMQEPLLAEEVWIAFDHTARLLDAFNQRPDDFVAFPAPAGPAGRGFMPVVAGLAIPKGTPDRAASADLIAYMTQPETQLKVMREVGFYPVVDVEIPADLPAGIALAAGAIRAQAGADDAMPSLLPVGLGDRGGEFNKVYMDTFQLIVLRGGDVRETLDSQGEVLAGIMEGTGAPCWAPDAASEGACPVE
jgi:multiple sugar transport system substrate-binding protein